MSQTLSEPLDQLVESLLWEGYALYPYTPGATKNATPTPFGIVYPPLYAIGAPSTFDHLELRCLLDCRRVGAAGGPRCGSWPRWAPATGRRRGGSRCPPAHRRPWPRRRPRRIETTSAGEGGSLSVALRLSAAELDEGSYEVVLRIENRTPCEHGLDRAGALAQSLISTHPLLRVSGGRFISPLERPCASVNTYPVLASDADDVVLGAAIVLPDHPRIAPESRGGLFDSTEIEEALLLHVQTLSDQERAQIEAADPAVREMVERAAAATPEDIVRLHGRVTMRDRDPVTESPPQPPPGLVDPSAGQSEAVVDGVRFRRGDHVRLRPSPDADLHARLLDGRSATIERIFVDYDGKMHLGVTIDGDPGQELMRETNRLLFFFAPEVEVIES